MEHICVTICVIWVMEPQIQPCVVWNTIFKLFGLPVELKFAEHSQMNISIRTFCCFDLRNFNLFVDIHGIDSWSITHYYVICHGLHQINVSKARISRFNIYLGTTACYIRIVVFPMNKCNHECNLLHGVPSWVHPATAHDQIRYVPGSHQFICRIVREIIRGIIREIILDTIRDITRDIVLDILHFSLSRFLENTQQLQTNRSWIKSV